MVEPGGDGDLPQEPLGAEDGGELGPQDLEGDGAVVLQVVGDIDGGHAAPAQLALDAVAARQSLGETGADVAHGEGRCAPLAYAQ